MRCALQKWKRSRIHLIRVIFKNDKRSDKGVPLAIKGGSHNLGGKNG